MFETVIELLIFVSLTNLNYQVLPQAILLSCCDWLKAQNKSVLVQVATFEFSEQFKVTLHFAAPLTTRVHLLSSFFLQL